jgi:stress response protein YsnF
VSVKVETEQRHVTLAAASESISIETVEIGREVAEAPPVRTEGNVTIIPILEEVTVVTKRLILKEEIRMTRTRTETTSVETVPLRTEHAVVERFSSHK